MKRPTWALVVGILGIGFAILKDVIALSALSSFVLMSMMVGGCFAIVVNAALLIIVATGDKSVFRAQASKAAPGAPAA